MVEINVNNEWGYEFSKSHNLYIFIQNNNNRGKIGMTHSLVSLP